ncbi:graves disease carrier protein-like isoform X2 [Acanthaster planci]|uniref:Graves disease carrier protein-like isoform X2 n=1 Tax=Acanthaster planci TaxID=133434 RepID=A0A8B7XJI7_ACAPL|nr:graves disease carrier protein-like isoform X2 [Acanthaster planci]
MTALAGSGEIIQNSLAGGIAGCCGKVTTAPLDRVKILLQAHHQYYNHLGVWSSLAKVVEHEGVRGLYRGNGAMMVRTFPYGAIQFVTYDWFKKKTKQKLLSGSLAGVIAVLFTYPLDMVRARLAYQVQGECLYRGILHTCRSIWHEEGQLRALYRGVGPTLLGMVPYAGAAFYSYEMGKAYVLVKGPLYLSKPSPANLQERVLTAQANLFIGGFAGAFAQTIVYPLDVGRRLMQLGAMVPNANPSSSCLETLVLVYTERGTQGLFRGVSINYLRAIPAAAVSFTLYEHLKQYLNIHSDER